MSHSVISSCSMTKNIIIRVVLTGLNEVYLYIKGRLGFRLINISDWVCRGALRVCYDYLNNSCLYINSVYEKRFSSFVKEIISSLETGWFLEFKLVGLAAKVIIFKQRKVVLELGHTHWDILNIPSGIKIWVKKRRIVVRALTKKLLSDFIRNLMLIKGPTPYKLRGIVLASKYYKLKPGKKK
jgi:hypothetical protein